MGDGARENSEYNTPTGGQAKFIRSFGDTANDKGINFDLSQIQYEVLLGSASYIKVMNTGEHILFVAFDSDFTTIDIDDRLTYNIRVPPLSPYNEIEINGEARKISLKCESQEESTFEIITW